MLRSRLTGDLVEAGCDEAGRGCLAGPVFAASVILPGDFRDEVLNDSKQLSLKQRNFLRQRIETEALAWSVARVDAPEIDEINILNASFLAMHKAVEKLSIRPEMLLIDGNRFKPYPGIPHTCIIKGDALFLSIAAASVLAKTWRDDYMAQLHAMYPGYGWASNKGYPTKAHRESILRLGITPFHRKSFRMGEQLSIGF
jgi:ribonuclease HII